MRYLDIYGEYGILIDGALETLSYLRERYRLGLVTNGFTDIQQVKNERTGLAGLIDMMLTSDDAGVMKPNTAIFHSAADMIGCPPGECLFVGDSYEIDVAGASESGMRTVWFNPGMKEPPPGTPLHNHEITRLQELTAMM